MSWLRHPLSGGEYHRIDGETVRVVGKDGVEGLFSRTGDWISGERRSADPGMCRYVAAAFWKDANGPSAGP